MRAFVFAVYLFLYAPIALVVLFSFNAGRSASEFTGFSVAWYGKAFSNTFLLQALQNSLIIAFASAALAAMFGTMAAIAIERMGPRTRLVFDGLFAAAIVVPGVVIGIATLVALVAVFSASQSGDRQHLAGRHARRSSGWATARSSPRTACSRWRW